jgi:hypothetical protein
MAFRKNKCLKAPSLSIAAFQPYDEWNAHSCNILAEGPIGERSGTEIRIKRRDEPRFYQVDGLRHFNL